MSEHENTQNKNEHSMNEQERALTERLLELEIQIREFAFVARGVIWSSPKQVEPVFRCVDRLQERVASASKLIKKWGDYHSERGSYE